MFSNAQRNASSNARQQLRAKHATQRNATNATRTSQPQRTVAFYTVREALWITRISRAQAVAS